MTNSEKILIFRSLLILLVICKYLSNKYIVDVSTLKFISDRVDGWQRELANYVNYLRSLD